jgi:putative flavoprotein involved in K+ transport
VGAGASGLQIAEDLLRSGRKVYLSVGRHKKRPRKYRGRDTIWWMDRLGMFEERVDALPSLAVALREPSPALTGFGGGHVLDLMRFARDGVTLVGRLAEVAGSRVRCAPDLKETLAEAERGYRAFLARIDAYVDAEGLCMPADDPLGPPPSLASVHETEVLDIDAAGISTLIWATGYANDYSWIKMAPMSPDGQPAHQRGVTAVPGLYFMGLPWQYKRKSHFIVGVAEDAEHIAQAIEAQAAHAEALPRCARGTIRR